MTNRRELADGRQSTAVLLRAIVALALTLGGRAVSQAADVVLLHGDKAADLEILAAEQCAEQLRRLFNVSTHIGENQTPQKGWVLIGSPQRNAVLAESQSDWPQLSSQGFVIRPARFRGQPAWIVGARSPAAALWGVYELGYRFGIRYLPREDVFPEPQPMKWTGVDQVFEPLLPARGWRTIGASAIGSESWPLAAQRNMINQLAKLKFNRLQVAVHPWQPFVHFEHGGVKKQTGVLFRGERYEIARDAPGRTALGGAKRFVNPDFADCENYDQRVAAGVRLVRGVMQHARHRGMRVALRISPFEFPREFRSALPRAAALPGDRPLCVAPGASQAHDDPELHALVASKITAYLRTYPQTDELHLAFPDLPNWAPRAEDAWKQLTAGWKDAPSLEQVQNAAVERPLAVDRGSAALRGDVVALASLQILLRKHPEIFRRPDGQRVRLVFEDLDPALHSWLSRLLPRDAGALLVDRPAPRTELHRDDLKRVAPTMASRSRLAITLSDRSVGVLSQSAARHAGRLAEGLRGAKWDGFCVRGAMLAEMDPAIHMLSRMAWDRESTARTTHDALFVTTTGKQAAADRLWLAFGHLEEAAELIASKPVEFAPATGGLLARHSQKQPIRTTTRTEFGSATT